MLFEITASGGFLVVFSKTVKPAQFYTTSLSATFIIGE